jgi:hypothetical protein
MNWFKKKDKNERSWKDVTLFQIQEIDTLPLYEDKIDLIINVLSILLDKDPFDIENMPVNDIFKEYKRWEFLEKKPEPALRPIIKHNGKRYGMIELSEISMAQFVDIDEYITEGLMVNLHKVLSALFLPITKYNHFNAKYKIEEYKPSNERKEMFKNIDMETLYPVILFFWNLENKYLKGFLSSFSKIQTEKMRNEISMNQELSTAQKKKLLKRLNESGIG